MTMDELDRQIAEYKRLRHLKGRKQTSLKTYAYFVKRRDRQRVSRTPNPCELILTGSRSPSGCIVRCYCMNEPGFSKRYYGYEPLGVVPTLKEAIDLWRKHTEEVKRGGTESDPPTAS